MDLQLVTENSTWDIDTSNGIPLTLDGDNENTQRAMIASFIQPNTIPLLPDKGNPWTDYMSGSISLTEIDAAVRKNINLYMESLFFVPFYNVSGNKLTYNISKVTMTGAK
jgi:hypothetical protein